MIQNIIVGIIVVFALIFLIRHFMKGKCGCGCSDNKSDKTKGGSCGGCFSKNKK